MDKPKKQAFLICSRAVKLISSIFFLGLIALDILIEVTFVDQVFDLILQFGSLLHGVPNVFVIRTIFVFIDVWSVSEWVRSTHEGLIRDGI